MIRKETGERYIEIKEGTGEMTERRQLAHERLTEKKHERQREEGERER